jgi:hypothetical protein
MNNLLTQKNEEGITKNSADFYTMMIYSKNILDLDKLRINEYKLFKRENISNIEKFNNDKNKFPIYKIFIGTSVSVFLMYKFKSIFVIPIFFTSYYLVFNKFIKFIIYYSAENLNKLNTECYFCEKNFKKSKKIENYEKYFQMINYIVDKDPNISTLKEFEKALDNNINLILKKKK